MLTPACLLIVSRAVGFSSREYIGYILPLASAGVMAASVLAVRLLIPEGAIPDALLLITLIVIGAVLYFALSARFVPGAVAEVRRLVPWRRAPLARAPS